MANMSERRGQSVFPVDAVEEILSRLPAKDVARCKLLSKTHLSLIKSPNFVSKHLSNNQSSNNSNSKTVVAASKRSFFNKMVSFLDSGVGVEDVYVPPPANSSRCFILFGSCNGLLCCQSLHLKKTSFFLVWNPATKEHMVLPNPQVKQFFSLGFGFDAVTKDYKLVKISGISPFRVELWTMSTNSWRDIEFPNSALPEHGVCDYPGVLVRGYLYWLFVSRLTRRAFIISFDLVNHSLRTDMALPESANIGSRLDLINFAGSLALSVAMPIIDGCRLYDIWVMNDDDDSQEEYSSWTKRFSIGPFQEVVQTTGVIRNGMFLMEDTSSIWGRFFLYDPQSKLRQPVNLQGFDSIYTPWSVTESLVSIKTNPESCTEEHPHDAS